MVDKPTAMAGRVGITFATAVVANPYRGDVAPREIDLLVDMGAVYSVLPSDVLEALGIAPLEIETFGLADGTKHEYPVGEAFFVLGRSGRRPRLGAAP